MQKIAVQDANIIIDLIKTGLFDHCLALAYQFTTTNIILDELYDEQIAVVQPHINSGKFELIQINAIELEEIQELSLQDTRLSEQDWSAYFFAKKHDALLLTGDSRLRTRALKDGIEVCGIFWVLDQLVDTGILEKENACSFLNDLISKNIRLPKEACDKRIALWCNIT